MQRSIVIIGNNTRQIRMYASQQLGLDPSEYSIGKDASSLRGKEKGVLIELEGCRCNADYRELHNAADRKHFIKIY